MNIIIIITKRLDADCTCTGLQSACTSSAVMITVIISSAWMQSVPVLGCRVPGLPAARVCCPPSEQSQHCSRPGWSHDWSKRGHLGSELPLAPFRSWKRPPPPRWRRTCSSFPGSACKHVVFLKNKKKQTKKACKHVLSFLNPKTKQKKRIFYSRMLRLFLTACHAL